MSSEVMVMAVGLRRSIVVVGLWFVVGEDGKRYILSFRRIGRL